MLPPAVNYKFVERAREVNDLLENNYPRYAIIAAGIGTELLLQVLFEELNEHYRGDNRRSMQLLESLNYIRNNRKKGRNPKRNDIDEKDLTFEEWEKRYELGGFLSKLSGAFGYEFGEFSISSIKNIRRMRNKCAHSNYYKNPAIIDRDIESQADPIRNSFLTILFETKRITEGDLSEPQYKTDPNLEGLAEAQKEIEIILSEERAESNDIDTSIIGRQSDLSQTTLDTPDLLFLYAFRMRDTLLALRILDKVLKSTPNHVEARIEKDRIQAQLVPVEGRFGVNQERSTGEQLMRQFLEQNQKILNLLQQQQSNQAAYAGKTVDELTRQNRELLRQVNDKPQITTSPNSELAHLLQQNRDLMRELNQTTNSANPNITFNPNINVNPSINLNPNMQQTVGGPGAPPAETFNQKAFAAGMLLGLFGVMGGAHLLNGRILIGILLLVIGTVAYWVFIALVAGILVSIADVLVFLAIGIHLVIIYKLADRGARKKKKIAA